MNEYSNRYFLDGLLKIHKIPGFKFNVGTNLNLPSHLIKEWSDTHKEAKEDIQIWL